MTKNKDENDVTNPLLLAGFEMTQTEAPPEPPVKPKFINIIQDPAPDHMKVGVGLSVAPPLAALTFGLQFRYANNKSYPPSAITFVAAPSGFGKSSTTEACDLITESLEEADKKADAVRAEYAKACARCKPTERKPEEPPVEDTAIRKMQPNQSRPNIVKTAKIAEQVGYRPYMNTKEVSYIKVAGEGEAGRTELFLAAGEDGPFGAGRATMDGESGASVLRLNINASFVTDNAPYHFNQKSWRDGVVARAYWVCLRRNPEAKKTRGIPREKEYKDDKLRAKIKPYLDNLMNTKGIVKCKQLNDIADTLNDEIDDLILLSDNEQLKEVTNRLIRHAWTFSMLLWVSEGCRYRSYIGEWMVYAFKYGLWSVAQVFGEYFIPKSKRRTVDEVKKYTSVRLKFNQVLTTLIYGYYI